MLREGFPTTSLGKWKVVLILSFMAIERYRLTYINMRAITFNKRHKRERSLYPFDYELLVNVFMNMPWRLLLKR